ncbi:MAG: hypothetical protein H7Y20_19935 [Bryobacteraceae bacterium]|nr:hypothetical protein [Bryobacteraceae bacterium]
MGRTTDLRREVKQRFWPLVRAQGFEPDETEAPAVVTFRHHNDRATFVFDIQWSKWGDPRFVVNFGTCPADGFEFRGQQIDRHSVLAGWLTYIGQAGRLQPRRGSSTRAWFRQDYGFFERMVTGRRLKTASAVVDELMRLFPEVSDYWSSGRVGKHLHVISRTR